MIESGEALNKWETILRSAFTIFTEKGYHSATVSDVAELAKVGKGTVYEYFSSKEDLLRGVIEEGIKYYMIELESSVNDPSQPWENIKTMIRRHADIIRGNENIQQIMFQNFGIMTEQFHQFLFDKRQALVEMIKDVVQKGIEIGQIRPMNAEIGARLILGSMMSIQCVNGCLDQASVEELIGIIEKGFLQM